MSDSPRWTLNRSMSAIAVLAIAFAILPWLLSAALAVTICGIVVVEGMRLPRVTSGGGPWRWVPWLLWSLALLSCPIAMQVMGTEYVRTGTVAWNGPCCPWASRVVTGLGYAHLGVSVIAAVAVVVLTRGANRWLAWGVILAIGMFTTYLKLVAGVVTAGIYL